MYIIKGNDFMLKTVLYVLNSHISFYTVILSFKTSRHISVQLCSGSPVEKYCSTSADSSVAHTVASTRTDRIMIPKLQTLVFLINFKLFKDDVPTADYIYSDHTDAKERTDMVHTKPAKRQQMVAERRNTNANSDVPIGNSWRTEAN